MCDESEDFVRSEAYISLEKQAKDIIFYQLATARFGRDLLAFTIKWYEDLLIEMRGYDE